MVAFDNFFSDVHLSLFSWQMPAFPVALLLLFAFLLGAFVMYLIAVSSARHERRQLKELRGRVIELEQSHASISMPMRVPTEPLPGSIRMSTGPLQNSVPNLPVVPIPGMTSRDMPQ